MAPRGYFTTGSLSAFIFLGIIRGTFSVAIHFAVHSYKSPSLVFLLRTPGTVALYVVFMIFLSTRDSEIREIFHNNFRTAKNYWKYAVMGFVQLAAPYMLFMYGLKVLNPSTGGCFMAAAPWLTILLERLPFVRTSHPVSTGKLGAITVGCVGIILVSASGIGLAAESDGHCSYKEVTPMRNYTSVKDSSVNSTNIEGATLREQNCTPLTAVELATALLALIGGSLMWSISSVFWRSKRGNIHYVSGGIGNNLFGGLFALVLFLILQRYEVSDEIHWNDGAAVFSIIFLTVISGWLAAVIVDYMYKEVGALVTNRVLCLVPLVAWFEDWMFVRKFQMLDIVYVTIEVVGVVLVFVGLTISNLEPENLASVLRRPLLSNSEAQETSDTSQFYQNVREVEDGLTSDEEVKNTSYLQSRTLSTGRNPFPPLVEVPRQDQ
ncbi:uncharacterized protein LOC144650503 [Oculina patagonica]